MRRVLAAAMATFSYVLTVVVLEEAVFLHPQSERVL